MTNELWQAPRESVGCFVPILAIGTWKLREVQRREMHSSVPFSLPANIVSN